MTEDSKFWSTLHCGEHSTFREHSVFSLSFPLCCCMSVLPNLMLFVMDVSDVEPRLCSSNGYSIGQEATSSNGKPESLFL